jgi:hypothetical protein
MQLANSFREHLAIVLNRRFLLSGSSSLPESSSSSLFLFEDLLTNWYFNIIYRVREKYNCKSK